MRRPFSRAYSLIEVLTVLTILAVLAAILFPVFARARRDGNRASAITRARQLAAAALQYAGDNNDKPPVYCGHCLYSNHIRDEIPTYNDGPNMWMVLLLPYVGSKPHREPGVIELLQPSQMPWNLPDLFFDPNDLKPAHEGVCDDVLVSWGISDAVVRRYGTDNDPGLNRVRSVSSFANPSKSVLFAQTESVSCRGRSPRMPGVPLALPLYEPRVGSGPFNALMLTGRYEGGRNMVAMLDGSVHFVPKTLLESSMEYWDQDYQPVPPPP